MDEKPLITKQYYCMPHNRRAVTIVRIDDGVVYDSVLLDFDEVRAYIQQYQESGFSRAFFLSTHKYAIDGIVKYLDGVYLDSIRERDAISRDISWLADMSSTMTQMGLVTNFRDANEEKKFFECLQHYEEAKNNGMHNVLCINKRKSVPDQIAEGDMYWLKLETIYTDPDGDYYGEIYYDPKGEQLVGNMLLSHFDMIDPYDETEE